MSYRERKGSGLSWPCRVSPQLKILTNVREHATECVIVFKFNVERTFTPIIRCDWPVWFYTININSHPSFDLPLNLRFRVYSFINWEICYLLWGIELRRSECEICFDNCCRPVPTPVFSITLEKHRGAVYYVCWVWIPNVCRIFVGMFRGNRVQLPSCFLVTHRPRETAKGSVLLVRYFGMSFGTLRNDISGYKIDVLVAGLVPKKLSDIPSSPTAHTYNAVW